MYRGAVDLLQCQPSVVMMVGAHAYDLRAPKAQGMQTAFVERPTEWGTGRRAEQTGDDHVDVVVTDVASL